MDILSEIKHPIASELESYKRLFDETLTHQDGLLNTVLSHIRSRKGKMMRPILVLLTAMELGKVDMKVLRSAVTLELLHTASLVHDDVVDESPERRGQRSVNAEYDNRVAVLVGDYLLSESLDQASLTGEQDIVRLVANLGKTLSAGEIFQISNIRDSAIDEANYFRIVRQKTAVLFSACGTAGALAVGAKSDRVKQMGELGEIIGICFQIRDDIFDYYDSAELGKPTGTDMMEGKLTLPAIYALQHHNDSEMLAIAGKVTSGEVSKEEVQRLVAFTKQNGGIDYAEQMMSQYVERGLKLLEAFDNQAVRRSLELYLHFVVDRTK